MVNISAIESQLFIFEEIEGFLKKDQKHDPELNDKYFERNENNITALFLDGYGLANMLSVKADKSKLDDIEKKLKERGYDKGRFGGRHFIQGYKET